MSNFNPDAPVFIPTFLRQSVPNGELNGVKKTFAPSREKPVVFLMFGSRGAGKTTQSSLLTKEYGLLAISSGSIFREGKQPFVELRRILEEEFGEGKVRRYNGVVLDRFIVNSEFDAFYVQSILNSVNLPVPFVFMLSIDPELASKRAEARGDNKVGHQHWRAVEQKSQAVTAAAVYVPVGCYKSIQVTEDNSIDDVFKEIKSTIETQLAELPANVTIPVSARREEKGMKLIDEYEKYMEIVSDVHAAVGNLNGRKDTAPISSIGAYLDREYFSFAHKKLRSLLSTFHVTLKADGVRFLVVKHKKYGYIGFPSAFTHCYDLNEMFQGVNMSSDLSPEAKKSITSRHLDWPVEILFDTELVVHNNQPIFYVFDFIYFWGLEGKKMRFEVRLKILREYFSQMSNQPQCILLKDYVPINKLRTLIPNWKEANLPIDGLVFQHNDFYRIGRDKFLVKWKPVELCTVDFRLANGVLEDDKWKFDLMVTDDTPENSAGFGETPYANAVAVIPSTIVKENSLCNGMIVELFLMDVKKMTEVESQSLVSTEWSFKGVRNDKTSPNKHSIVTKIVELKHLTLEELLELCDKVPFYGTN
ncbi:putative RNA guanylyltransferase [Trypanosoma theileri]|uniref:Putative RNA guanylyltransferase n=1 Tax=Trypanosoma theileri TaxID=67003 RepID=A0A1X0NUI5_9TRYP|nr:putative RNA guanylyltransferase [Trypanosoma theileri]ORC88355.1 putative RNA guanylyltransferase [Trypanosoma theileri]